MRFAFVFLSALIGCSPTSELEKTVEFVQSEAVGISGTRDTSSDKFRFYAALSAMNFVQTNLSSARYSLSVNNGENPESGTEICLVTKRGICGNHVEAFLDILLALNIPAREVQVYFSSGKTHLSHIVAEVEWRGTWHMFDVTWGFIPHDGDPMKALSFLEAKARGTTDGWHNETNPWRAVNREVFSYITAPSDVVIDGEGTVRPYVTTKTQDRIHFGFEHLPDYIGSVPRQSGNFGEVTYAVSLPSDFDTLTIDPEKFDCDGGTITAGKTTLPLDSSPKTFTGLTGRTTIRAKGHQPLCHVVISEIYASRNTHQQ